MAYGRGYGTPPEGAVLAVAAARVQATEAGLRAEATEARASSEVRATHAEARANVAESTAAAAQQVAGIRAEAAERTADTRASAREEMARAHNEAAAREMAAQVGAAEVRVASAAAVHEARADLRVAQAESTAQAAVSAAESEARALLRASEMERELAALRAQLELERRTAALEATATRRATTHAPGGADELLELRRTVAQERERRELEAELKQLRAPAGNGSGLPAGGEAPTSEPDSYGARGLTQGGLAALDVGAWWALPPAELAVVGASHREHYRSLLEARSGAALRPQAHEAAARVRELGELLAALPGLQTLEDAEELLTAWAKASVARLEVLREGIVGGGWTSAQAMEDAYFVAPTVPEYLQPMWKFRRSGTTQQQQQQQQQQKQQPQQQQQQQQQQQRNRHHPQPQPKAANQRRHPH